MIKHPDMEEYKTYIEDFSGNKVSFGFRYIEYINELEKYCSFLEESNAINRLAYYHIDMLNKEISELYEKTELLNIELDLNRNFIKKVKEAMELDTDSEILDRIQWLLTGDRRK